MNKLRTITRISVFYGMALLLLAGCKEPVAPVADFEYSVDESTLTVTFTNQSTDATTYHWDFGDGQTSDAEAPSHVYDDFGSYEVTLTATGDGGSDESTQTVEILALEPVTIDGTFTEWAAVNSLYNLPDGEGRTLIEAKVIDSQDYLYVYVKGTAAIGEVLQMYIDADNNGTTGWGYWGYYDNPGVEYLMEAVVVEFPDGTQVGSVVKTATGADVNWPWEDFVTANAMAQSSGYVTVDGGKAIEFSLLKDMFSFPNLGSTIRITFANSDNTWTNVGTLPQNYADPLAVPAAYTMAN